jgi:hypothetical protein
MTLFILRSPPMSALHPTTLPRYLDNFLFAAA